MNRITCPVIRDLLPLYTDDALSEDSRALVEEHLAGCEACKEELEHCKQAVSLPPETETSPIAALKNRLRKKKVILMSLAACCTALVLSGITLYVLCYYHITVPYDPVSIQITEVSGEWFAFTKPTIAGGISCSERIEEFNGMAERVLYISCSYTPMTYLRRHENLEGKLNEGSFNMDHNSDEQPISRIYYIEQANRLEIGPFELEFPPNDSEPVLLWEAEGAPLRFPVEANG